MKAKEIIKLLEANPEADLIFWDGNEKSFEFKTTVTQPANNTMSLLDLWKKKGEK